MLWICTRHPRTPLLAKALAVALVGYAFSPIDLIPDFIPVLGYLDDLVILPLGVWLVLKLVPARRDGRMPRRGGPAHRRVARRAEQPARRRRHRLPVAGGAGVCSAWLAWRWLAAGSLKNATASAALRVILIGGRLCSMRLP